MIYSVKFGEKKSFNSCYEFLISLKNFAYHTDMVYINVMFSKQELFERIRKLVSYEEMFFIEEVTENNLYRQPELIQGWIKEIWKIEKIEKEKKEFEMQHKSELQQYSNFLDFMDKELDNQLNNKRENKDYENRKE
jgi:hypothetical protein